MLNAPELLKRQLDNLVGTGRPDNICIEQLPLDNGFGVVDRSKTRITPGGMLYVLKSLDGQRFIKHVDIDPTTNEYILVDLDPRNETVRWPCDDMVAIGRIIGRIRIDRM